MVLDRGFLNFINMTETKTGLTLLQENKPTLAQLILVSMPKGTTIEEATNVAIKEISNYEMLVSMKPDLKDCNALSVLHAVKQCINDGLTLSQSAGLVYLLPTKVKVGQNGSQDIYDWALSYDPTANGRLSIAYQSGSILDHKNPKVTYSVDGKVESVTFEFLVPSYGEPRWEVISFDKIYFQRWMAASAKKNKGNANMNYTSFNGGIDPEFAKAKAIRHGLGKRGTNLNGKRHQVPMDKMLPVEVVNKEAKEEMFMDEYVRTQAGKIQVTDAVIESETKGDLPV